MKKLLSIVLALCMALSLCVTTWADENSFDVTTVGELENAFANTTITGKTTINIKNDLDFSGVTWNPSDFAAAAIVVIDGGTGVKLSNLTSPLIKACGVGQVVTIKNVTIGAANISGDAFALAAFIGNADNSDDLTFENCKLTNSTVTNTSGYAGGFVGYTSIASETSSALHTFTNCQVVGCTITGKNSTGGLIGHATGAAGVSIVVTNATVKGNTITCNDDSKVKAGSLLGTVGAGNITASANVSGNTVKSGDDTTGVATITTIYGRQGDSAGTLTLTGGSYDNAPLGASDDWADYADDTPVATDENGNYYVGSDSIAAAANSGTTVTVIKGGAINGLQPGATVEVTENTDGDVTLNGEAVGAGSYTVPEPPAEPAHSHTRRQPTTTTEVAPDTTKTDVVTSAKTFDAGIAVYAAMGVLSLTGSAWIVGKKRG